MTKRRQPPGYRMDQHVGHKPDPLVRVVAAHPSQPMVVVGVGPALRLLNCSTGEVQEMQQEGGHQGFVRYCSFSPDGQLLLTGSDDKTCKLWNTAARSCIATWRMHKKLSAGAFSQDNAYALFADKFGDVAVTATGAGAGQPSASQDPELLLGHLCSIVTSVAVTADNKFVATADRDGRVRVNPMPAEPLKGAYEIQSYCLGHQNFVTKACFPPGVAHEGAPVLVTGSGDGTVRVWNAGTGQLLSTYVAAQPRNAAGTEPGSEAADAGGAGEGEQAPLGQGDEAAAAQEEEEEEDAGAGTQGGGGGGGGEQGEGECDRSNVPDCAAVVDVAVSRDGQTVAVLVEGEQEVQVLSLDPTTHQLSSSQRVTVPSVAYPCRADWDQQGRLWLVGGPPLDTSKSLHMAVLGLRDGGLCDITPEVLNEGCRAQLEQRSPEEEAKLASGELEALLTKPMQRKKYDQQLMQKRPRNDYKENLRLAQLRAQQQAPQS